MNALRPMTPFIMISALFLPSLAHASLQQELDGMFGDMTNYTSPGTYETQRRGVISGGSFVNRTRIMQENLIGFVPPSASASCSGVDLYGGSFSFINTDQLVQLLRSIAANARGYAFQLALSAMCEKCMQNIETLQKKIQQFNQYFSNSCQLAKGLVTDARDSFRNQAITTQAMAAHFRGFGDLFSSWSQADGMTPEQKANQVARDDVVRNVEGNLVWRALKRHNAAARLASVSLPMLVLSRFRTFGRHSITMMTWGGLRGAISVALALSLPDLPARGRIVAATYVVVIFSILVQALTVGNLAERLGLRQTRPRKESAPPD